MRLLSPEQLRSEIEELNRTMSDPAVSRDPQKMKVLSQEHAQKGEFLRIAEHLAALNREREGALTLKENSDEELSRMAEEDLLRLDREIMEAQKQAEDLLIARDPKDERDVILEIRAGAGGEEAALFAAELFRAYSRLAERRRWDVHIVSSSLSEQHGFKEVIAEVSGRDVYGALKHESGVHRVQRVPETEKMGRIHTSTITVAILPQAEEVDLVIRPEDLRIDTYRSSGAGGQHVNKTSSAIRITHLPTNTVVAVQDERSQHKNKEKAMKILRSRLLAAEEEKRRAGEASTRRQQVGTGDRSEKIRTYNFPQDRITDHRLKESWSNIPGVMEGNWDNILDAVKKAEREQLLKQA